MKFVWEDKEDFIKSIWDYSEEEIYYVLSDLIDDFDINFKVGYFIKTPTGKLVEYIRKNEETIEAYFESGLEPIISITFYSREREIIHKFLDSLKQLNGYEIYHVQPNIHGNNIKLFKVSSPRSHKIRTGNIKPYFSNLVDIRDVNIDYRKHFYDEDTNSKILYYFDSHDGLIHSVWIEYKFKDKGGESSLRQIDVLCRVRSEFEKSYNNLKSGTLPIRDLEYNIFFKDEKICFIIEFYEK